VFGLVKPCAHHMGAESIHQYREHMCGSCLALREATGQASRAAVNHDALVLSLLVEELSGQVVPRTPAKRCPLRGMRAAHATDPGSEAARYAAAIALTVLHTGVNDHASDPDRGRLLARIARPTTRRWHRKATLLAPPAAAPALDGIASCTATTEAVEHRAGQGFEAYAASTSAAFGHAFAGVGMIVNRQELVEGLRTCGTAFGTIANVVDALEDFDSDARHGGFNLLKASWPAADQTELARHAHRILQESLETVTSQLSQLGIGETQPAGHLLLVVLRRRAHHALSDFRHAHGIPAAGFASFTTRPAVWTNSTGTTAAPAPTRRRRGLASLVGVLPVSALCCCDCDCDCGGCDCCDCDGCCCDNCCDCDGCCCDNCCCCDCGGGSSSGGGSSGGGCGSCMDCGCDDCSDSDGRKKKKRHHHHHPHFD
jgi:hypothetical protein